MKISTIPQSGSVNGQTSSRNRFGQYIRRRAVPVNPATSRQNFVRSATQDFAAAWRALTDAQRAAWASLGQQMLRTDSLGQTYNLTGEQAFVSLNNTLRISGQPTLTDAPALTTPDPIQTIAITLTTASFSIAFTPTPLAADEWLQIWCSPQRSAGRTFEADFRLVFAGALATASPANILAAYSARFGAPVAGNRIFVRAYRCKAGFSSTPISASAVVAP